ncbi:MAG: TolC family protein [Myxococcota bacterium]|nr:TolC family protein [Myxococcota bacterium]
MGYSIALPTCVSSAVAAILAVAAPPISARAEPEKGAIAEQPSGGSDISEIRVTWSDIAALVDRHPSIAVGNQKTAAAQAAVDAARAVPNPNLAVNAAYGRARDASASRVEWGVGLSMPLGWIAKRKARVAAAQAGAGVAAAASETLRRDVLLQLSALFWHLSYEQERVTALAALNHQTAALARTIKQRVDKGESRPVAATRVEIEVEKIAGELAFARSALEMRQVQLGLWLGIGNGQRIVVAANLTELPQHISAATARERVRTGHPTLVTGQAEVQALTADVALERRQRMPGASVQVFTDHELDRTAYGVGLAVELPLWNLNKGNINQAQALLAARKSQLDAERIEIASVAIEAQATCQAGVGLAIRYRDQIQPRADSAANTIERTYALGEATLLELIDARRTLLETRMQRLAAFAQAQTECGRLAVLIGEETQ